MLSIDEAERRYSGQIEAIRVFERSVVDLGYTMVKSDEFELGAEWTIKLNDKEIGAFAWNVPHLMRLEIGGKSLIDEDYIDDLKMWKETLQDCEIILREHLESR